MELSHRLQNLFPLSFFSVKKSQDVCQEKDLLADNQTAVGSENAAVNSISFHIL